MSSIQNGVPTETGSGKTELASSRGRLGEEHWLEISRAWGVLAIGAIILTGLFIILWYLGMGATEIGAWATVTAAVAAFIAAFVALKVGLQQIHVADTIGHAQVEMAREQIELAKAQAELARRQTEASVFTSGVTLADNIRMRLNSNEFREVRRKAAKAILANAQTEDAVLALLNEFEYIGILVDRGALDEEIIYNACSDWVFHYWPAVRYSVESDIKSDPIYWEYLVKLHKTLAAIETKKGGKGEDPAHPVWEAFLKIEAG